MPRAVWAIGWCVLATMAGCERFFAAPDRAAGAPIARSLMPAIPADALIVEKILLERPLGDVFLDRGLWTATRADWRPELRELLSRNGIQAGVLTGTVPPEFQAMVANKAEVVDKAQRMTFNHRREAVVPTAGPLETCTFDLLADLAGKPAAVSFKDASCGILVRPQTLTDGRVRLWCEPQIQHGNREQHFRPSEDGTQFTRREEVPTEAYPTVGFEAALMPDECLVIGCVSEQQGSLGRALFYAEASGYPRQRLLVLRARQLKANPAADLPPIIPPGRLSAR